MAGPEDEIQKACVKMLHLFEAQGRLRFFSVPNEGKRGFKAAQRLKNLGRRAGVPDLVILPTNGAACFIEMKAPKGTETDAQKDWKAWLAEHYRHAICRSVDEMLFVLKDWI